MMYAAKASIKLDADVSVAWEFISDFKNFSEFLSNIREIRSLGDHLWEWRLHGILGIPLFCKTRLTLINSSKKVVWDAVEGPIATTGWAQVEPLAPGSKLTMSLNYHPETGVLNDVFHRMFENPQKILEDDLSKLPDLLIPTTHHIIRNVSYKYKL